jgi:hypothetical protein
LKGRKKKGRKGERKKGRKEDRKDDITSTTTAS